MTLSQWLRDYLYIPLGGNRATGKRVMANLLVTMTLGGLWHGAGWNFLAWGALHGLLLIAHRLLTRPALRESAPLRAADAPKVLGLFHAVVVLWVFFRTSTPTEALAYFGGLLGRGGGGDASGWPALQLGVVVLCILLHGLERFGRIHANSLRRWLDPTWGAAIEGSVAGIVIALALWLGGTGGEFIYFQF